MTSRCQSHRHKKQAHPSETFAAATAFDSTKLCMQHQANRVLAMIQIGPLRCKQAGPSTLQPPSQCLQQTQAASVCKQVATGPGVVTPMSHATALVRCLDKSKQVLCSTACCRTALLARSSLQGQGLLQGQQQGEGTSLLGSSVHKSTQCSASVQQPLTGPCTGMLHVAADFACAWHISRTPRGRCGSWEGAAVTTARHQNQRRPKHPPL